MTEPAYPFQLHMPVQLNHGITIARRMTVSALPDPGASWAVVPELETKVHRVYPDHDPYPVVELCGFALVPGRSGYAMLKSFSQAGWFFSPPGMVDRPRNLDLAEVKRGPGGLSRQAEKTMQFFNEHYELIQRCDHFGSHVEEHGKALLQLARANLDYAATTTGQDIMRSLRKHLRKVRQIRKALG
jgi:hypothetical protein